LTFDRGADARHCHAPVRAAPLPDGSAPGLAALVLLCPGSDALVPALRPHPALTVSCRIVAFLAGGGWGYRRGL
jgi:hypothetical protein